MVDKTLSELITAIEKGIYQSPGIAVQVYSQDLISDKIQDCFILLATDPEVNWKRFYTFANYTLDGVTGRVTGNVAATFASYDDIYAVYPSNSDRQLVKMSGIGNPSRINGSTPLQVVADTTSTKVFRVLPITATGDVTVVGRSLPSLPFALSDTVPFDYLAIKWYVIWKYMTEDGSNPAAAELARQEFETRYKQLKKFDSQEPIAINGRGSYNYPTEWYDAN